MNILAAGFVAPGPDGRVGDPDLPARFGPRAVRRLTRLTRLALPAVEAALGAIDDPTVGLVVGTGLADLEQTAGFLDGLHDRGPRYASPQMFQRSVHGAVAGELAILYNLRGYNMTVTQGLDSSRAALALAQLALDAGRCQRCLCVAVDALTPALIEATAALGRPPPAEGAAALLLAPPPPTSLTPPAPARTAPPPAPTPPAQAAPPSQIGLINRQCGLFIRPIEPREARYGAEGLVRLAQAWCDAR